MSTFTNPIIPGFYPDPSCIRVGDVFYMANSSFQFFPGIPIHRSKDLINWELIGNAINRPSQISLNQATTKINNASRREIFTGGIYTPTIRYHNGVLYIVCTNLTGAPDMPSSKDFHPSNFIIIATDLSDPDVRISHYLGSYDAGFLDASSTVWVSNENVSFYNVNIENTYTDGQAVAYTGIGLQQGF